MAVTAVAPASRAGSAGAGLPAAASPTGAAAALGTRRRPARRAGMVLAVVGLIAVAFASVAVGSKPISLGTVWDALVAPDLGLDDHVIVRTMRVPRTAVGLLVGVGLGLAGAVMQGVTRNPLADPGLFGIEAGASLAVVVGIHAAGLGSFAAYMWCAFAGAAAAGVAVYLLGAIGQGGARPVKLALAGAALSALLGSLTSAILLLDVDTLDQFRFWVVGSLAGRDAEIAGMLAPVVGLGALVALASARSLDTLALGDDVARSLGARIGLARARAALAVVILAGAATAAVGPIAFVGLTVPHAARAIAGPDHRWLLPWSAVLGATLVVGADVVGRVVARPAELQVGIVTALVGAPFFIALVRRRRLAEL